MDPTQASRAAAAAAAKARGVQPKKKDKNKKSNNDKDTGGLFEGDGTGRTGPDGSGAPSGPVKGVSKVYAGGPRSGKLRLPSTGPSKQELNKIKRGGKGKKSFKSKARHKRK